jgi:hypothetical protein
LRSDAKISLLSSLLIWFKNALADVPTSGKPSDRSGSELIHSFSGTTCVGGIAYRGVSIGKRLRLFLCGLLQRRRSSSVTHLHCDPADAISHVPK